MSKNILVITGSPRKNGNSFALTDAFIRAAEAKGHTVTRFDAALKNVAGCRVCGACFKTGKPCAFNDDFNAVAALIQQADTVIFTMPLYWYTVPAQIKSVIDRMYAFYAAGVDIANKQCGLIACCEEKDVSAMEGLLFAYHRSIDLMRWQSVGEVLVSAVRDPGDVLATDGCQRAAALAELL